MFNFILRLLHLKSSTGYPNVFFAPKWSYYLGQTPDGRYFWLSNYSVVENLTSDSYFPDSNKTQYTGFYDENNTSKVIQIRKV